MPLTATLTDRDALLDALRAANVVTAAQLTRANTLAPNGSAPELALALVGANILTRFQAERLLTGRTDGFILGQHIILEQVGRGTMSRVYKAKHRTMNRAVAIKVLSSELTRTKGQRANFQREIRAAGKLTHPNVVTAYDASELQDRFYLVLEFVDGPNLESLVCRRGPLPVGEACEFIRQATVGLQHAHEKGMIHGDLKPANLLVARPTPSAPLTVKIADFGIPKASHAADFAAPEQHATGVMPVDARTDLYSLGCVFYFLLTGRAPFAGGTAEEKAKRHLWEEAPPVTHLRPDIPPDVAGIVHRMLAKHPASRFASAAELLPYLETACVPVATAVDDVCFELPAYPTYPGHDSGYLTGRNSLPSDIVSPQPRSGAFTPPPVDVSPWSQLTDDAVNEGDTIPVRYEDTPHTPHPARRTKPKSKPHVHAHPPGHGEGVPIWMIAMLLVGVVMLCLMGIGVVVRMLAK